MRAAILFLATSTVGAALACPGETTASTEPATEAAHVDTLEGFSDRFRAALARRGPFLIEFRI